MANKVTTKSYVIKRLRDCGYSVNKLEVNKQELEYAENDTRKWTIVIDNGCSTILFTCLKDGTVQVYDGGRFLNTNLRLDTDSIEVIIEYFNDRGIVNKHWKYGEPREDI